MTATSTAGSSSLLAVLAVLVLGPERLPEYAAKLGRCVRQARAMADGAKRAARDQMGPEFDDIDWQQFDPRQYDPRRIVREALLDDDSRASQGDVNGAVGHHRAYDPSRPTPWDTDAT